jgi:hypothetical protein
MVKAYLTELNDGLDGLEEGRKQFRRDSQSD